MLAPPKGSCPQLGEILDPPLFCIANANAIAKSSVVINLKNPGTLLIFLFEFFTNYIGIFVFTAWKQKKSTDKMLPPNGDRSQASHNLLFQVQHYPFWASEACPASEIFKLLFVHHLIFGLWGTERI